MFDVGHDIRIEFDADGHGLTWKHPEHRAWMGLRFTPDPASTGHVLVAGGIAAQEKTTIQGSLLCPMGCGRHGFITDGKWIPA